MSKTENEIERDFFLSIKESALGNAIRGEVYRTDQRPANSPSEDLIVKFLSGNDEQIQSGTVVINLYVPDIESSDGKTKDITRIGELQELIKKFVSENEDTDYMISTERTPYSTKDPDIEQHLIVARLKFQRLSQ